MDERAPAEKRLEIQVSLAAGGNIAITVRDNGVGIAGLAFGGFSFTHREKVIDLGPIQASADKKESLPVPPILVVAPPAIATDALADLIFSLILDREAELVAATEADAAAGFPGQKEPELAVVRALLRLVLSPNVRMPLSRLQ
jgi:hypothetical protein